MSKPDWCPQDLWDKARSAEAWATPLYADGVSKSEKREVVEAFADALLSERERCAKVADACRDRATSQPLFPLARNLHTQAEAAQRIASEIRGGQSHD